MFSSAMLLRETATVGRSSNYRSHYQAPLRLIQEELGADTRSVVLIGEEFENQLTHPLFIFRLKFQKLYTDRERLNRRNHCRIDLDVRLSAGSMQDHFYECTARK